MVGARRRVIGKRGAPRVVRNFGLPTLESGSGSFFYYTILIWFLFFIGFLGLFSNRGVLFTLVLTFAMGVVSSGLTVAQYQFRKRDSE